MCGILRVDADFVDGFPAGARYELLPPLPAQQRAGLRHPVTHHIGKTHFPEAAFHFRLKRRPAHDEAAHPAAERGLHFLSHGPVNQFVQAGYCQKYLHFPERRLDGAGIDLLHHQRHRDYHIRAHLLHRFEKCRRRRSLSQEVHRHTVDVGMDELDGKAVHVRQREHGNDGFAGMVWEMAVAEIVRVGKGPVSEHNALGIAGGAGSIVDDGYLAHVVFRNGDLFGPHTLREAETESGLPVLPGLRRGLIGIPQQPPAPDVDGGFQKRHRFRTEPGPDVFVCKQQHAVGMVHKRLDAVRMEIRQKRHGHPSVRIDSPEGHRPSG